MHFTTIIALLALVASVHGLPPTPNPDWDMYTNSSDLDFEIFDLDFESAGPCGALARKAVCCKKSLLGAIDFKCHRPQGDIQRGADLEAACAAKRKEARCCVLGVLGLYVLCEDPPGVAHLEILDDTGDNFGVVTADQ